jgi:glycosyltransferase involved in cell wall biosynthesis
VIYNGVDTEYFQPRSRAHHSGRKLKLLCITRLIELKGIQYLIDAIGQLTQENVELTIAGTGEYEAQLKGTVADKKLDSRIHFLGQVSHDAVRKLYHGADVFVFPSYGDAFPISVLEAMACELPVIATDYGGAKEIITQGDSGLLVRSRDTADLVKAIRYLNQDANLRESMGKRGRMIASQKFSWDTIVRQYVDVYQSAIGESCERRIDRLVL